MSTPNLGNIIPEGKARKAIYSALALVGVGLGAAQVGFAAAVGEGVIGGVPAWVPISLTIYGFIAAPLGLGLAVSNTPESGAAS